MDILEQIKAKSARLAELRKKLSTIEEAEAMELAPHKEAMEKIKAKYAELEPEMKEERNALDAELLDLMVSADMKTYKTLSGHRFTITEKPGMKIVDEKKALGFILTARAYKVDFPVLKNAMKDIRENGGVAPEGFEFVTDRFMSVSLAK